MGLSTSKRNAFLVHGPPQCVSRAWATTIPSQGDRLPQFVPRSIGYDNSFPEVLTTIIRL